jgi:plastocyanin
MKKIYVSLSFVMLSLFYFSQTSGLFFSEYAEGSSNNKYMEIYNGTGATVDLSEYAFPNVSNAPNVPGEYEYWNNFPIGATVADGDVYIIAHPSSDPLILAEADHTFSFMSNGDDGFCLVKQDGSWVDSNNDQIMQDSEISGFIYVDWIGTWDADPGTAWDVAGVTNGTQNHTLLRKETICTGNSTPLGSFGTNTTDSEWEVLDIDTWTNLGAHVANCGGGTLPIINSDPNSLSGFVQFVGSPSDEQTTEISGSNLTADVTATVSGDYEISLTTSVGFGPSVVLSQTAGELAATIVYVRLNGSVAVSPADGEIVLSSTGADNNTVALSGEILNPDPVIFVTEDTLSGFSHFVGTPSDVQSFEVSGNYLIDNVNISFATAIEYGISTDPTGPFTNSVTLISGAAPMNYLVETVGSTGFSPGSLNISVGDTVTFVNTGGNHNVNGTTNTFPGNPESFGNAVGAGWTFQHVFQTPGSYDYQCDPHAGMGMTGSIIVSPASPGSVANTAIYVQLNGSAQNLNQTGEIVVSSASATSQSVFLFGETLDYISSTIGSVTSNDNEGVAESLGDLVQLEGVVHCIDFDGNEGYSFTIIDENNDGINVFSFSDVSGYVVNEGEQILINGQIEQYNGLTEIVPDTIIVIAADMPTVTPTVVTSLDETTESQWITIENLDFVTPIATFPTGSNNIDVTDGTNVYTIRIDSDTDIPGSVTPQAPFNVTGVGGQYDSSSPFDEGYQLFPCGTGSFESTGTTGVEEQFIKSVTVYPNPVSDYVTVSLSEEGVFQLIIRDCHGRILENRSMNDSVTISSQKWSKGVYMIEVRNEIGISKNVKIIK